MVTKSALFVRALAGRSFQGWWKWNCWQFFRPASAVRWFDGPWRESETRIIAQFEVNFGSADLVKATDFSACLSAALVYKVSFANPVG
jgi:hypothetical protein